MQYWIADSTMEAKYVATCEAAKEAIWLKKFLFDLGVVRIEQVPITLFCDNSWVVAQSKDSRMLGHMWFMLGTYVNIYVVV